MSIKLEMVKEGHLFFNQDSWYIELTDGDNMFLERWPSADLYCGRDENRRARVVVVDGKAAFLNFLD